MLLTSFVSGCFVGFHLLDVSSGGVYRADDTPPIIDMSELAEFPYIKVWYDSACPLCVREIDLMRRLDTRGAIDFVDLYTAEGCPVDRRELIKRFHAQERGHPAVSGAAAFATMWRAIPKLRPLGLIARFRPVLWILELAYRGFLLIRPRLQTVARKVLES